MIHSNFQRKSNYTQMNSSVCWTIVAAHPSYGGQCICLILDQVISISIWNLNTNNAHL